MLVVVDGRRRGYSDGMTLRELADLMRGLGARDAINLDGGGSTTLVYADPIRPAGCGSRTGRRILRASDGRERAGDRAWVSLTLRSGRLRTVFYSCSLTPHL